MLGHGFDGRMGVFTVRVVAPTTVITSPSDLRFVALLYQLNRRKDHGHLFRATTNVSIEVMASCYCWLYVHTKS